MISQARIRELFLYREDGNLVRRNAGRGVREGSVAGSLNALGYVNVMVDGKLYLLHRLVFLYHRGWLPKMVDHRSNNKKDSRIENLRDADFSENSANRKTPKNNSTGIKNVCRRGDSFEVSVTMRGLRLRKGGFSSSSEAGAFAIKAREKMHGEFANHTGTFQGGT